LNKAEATGGGDEAEDVAGGLEESLKFDFGESGMNIVFLIA